jgi:D-alanine-D-alanine ligase
MRRIRVGIIFGGRSGEHEVSLASAASVLNAIDRTRDGPVPIGVAKDGRWVIGGDPLRALGDASGVPLALPGDQEQQAEGLRRVESAGGLPAGLVGQLDVVFPLIHGQYGEDGTLQGLLELANLPYVGAGVLASAVGMDKAMMKTLFRAHGLPVVEWLLILRREWEAAPRSIEDRVANEIGFPCFVKPANQGSSVGISKVTEPLALPRALNDAGRFDRKIMIERAVVGRELEVAVLGNDDPLVSLPGEVIPLKEWYDYEAKYTEGLTRFVIPAPLTPQETARLQELAREAFRAIDCAGMARVDFFLEDGRILVNEINTIPGFTQTSAYPKLMAASGIPYPELIHRLIQLALERHAETRGSGSGARGSKPASS